MDLEWIWPKNKFLDRKYEMNEMYLDFMDDGVINTEKYMVCVINSNYSL